MELVKGGSDKERCKEIGSTTGKRCTRSAIESGYCRQHYKMAEDRGEIIDLSGNKPIDSIPEPPVKLGKRGLHSWKIYCRQMIDEERLYQSYLYPLSDLCDLEDQLADIRKEMKDKGIVNVYDTAVQRNGYASHYDKVLQHIRNLRADYRLTEAHRREAVEISSENDQPKSIRKKTVTGYTGK